MLVDPVRTALPVAVPSKPFVDFILRLLIQATSVESKRNDLSDAPFKTIPPPSAVASDGVATEPNWTTLSSTLSVVEFIVVVVPLTVRLPAITTSPVLSPCVAGSIVNDAGPRR